MPELKKRFQAGRMNKDLDERLVPNGEYRDALNIEVSASESSDIGAVQTVMGNTKLSFEIPSGSTCIGEITNEKEDKLYWLVSGQGQDFIVEYDYTDGSVNPVVVDLYAANNTPRVLNFDVENTITGINIIDGMLFWTDNNSEPKRIHIERCKEGTPLFTTSTILMVRNLAISPYPPYVPSGPLREEHITVIKKSPPAAPVLEMKNTSVGDIDNDTVSGEITTTIIGNSNFRDHFTGEWQNNVSVIFATGDPLLQPDFETGDFLTLRSQDNSEITIRVRIVQSVQSGGGWEVNALSGHPDVSAAHENWDVELEQTEPLFQFKFARFGYRYKYEDGEYSTFSPFTEVAFIPDQFDYLPKEGYNLGMVNTLRKLAVKDFVNERQIPDDVVSIDILYKESNSPSIYSVKTIKRINPIVSDPDEWNSVSADNNASTATKTKGYVKITSEMIHAILPSNQLLRPWDNVPRKALAQEIIGNRLVYGNYLQNYNLENFTTAEPNIEVDLKIEIKSRDVGTMIPEKLNPLYYDQYRPSRSIKSLRTYQLGVVFIDEYGRETPVFSSSKTNRSSTYVEKQYANKAGYFKAQVFNTMPEWARSYKYFIKETASEYYNLAMDRWYDAEDGNIWLSFPSSERNKVDIETFLILKKEHDADAFVDEKARYKVIAIENEAPTFVKTDNFGIGIFADSYAGGGGTGTIGVSGGLGWPLPEGNSIYLAKQEFIDLGWAKAGGSGNDPEEGKIHMKDVSKMWFRMRGDNNVSNWYNLVSCTYINTGGFFELKSKTPFKDDMGMTSANNDYTTRFGGLSLEIVERRVENKPEFEGRFFVKILKDATIINRIIKPQFDSSTKYIVKQAKLVQYINPYQQNSDTFTWYGYGKNKDNISWGQETDINNIQNGEGWGYWNHASFGTVTDTSGWFIDAVRGFRRFKHTKKISGKDKKYHTSPVNAFTSGANIAAFILTGNPTVLTGAFDLAGHNEKATQVLGTDFDFDSAMGEAPGISQTNLYNWTGAVPIQNDCELYDETGIVPSIGIDGSSNVPNLATGGVSINNDNNIIHLSFSGIGDWEGTNPHTNESDAASYNWDLNNWASKHAGDTLFINELMMPGTIWRWKEDPDQQKYKTTTVPGLGSSSSPQTITDWQANTTDDQDGNPGISLFNYCEIYDYVLDQHHKRKYRYVITDPVFGNQIVVATATDWVKYWVTSDQGDHNFDTSLLPPYGVTFPGIAFTNITGGHGPNSPAHLGDVAYPQSVFESGKPRNRRRRFQFHAMQLEDPTKGLGDTPHKYLPTNDPDLDAHFDSTGTALTTTSTPALGSDPAPGIRSDGVYSGYTVNGVEVPNMKRYTSATVQSTAPGSVTWQILEPYADDGDIKHSSTNPAIWETEPKENVGLDIYYEVGQIYPAELNDDTIEQFVGPINQILETNSSVVCMTPPTATGGWTTNAIATSTSDDIRVASAQDSSVYLEDVNGVELTASSPVTPSIGDRLLFYRADGSRTESEITAINSPNEYVLDPEVSQYEVILPWFNCYSFGNGVESNRIRDDFNQVVITNGVKASTTLEEPYLEERRASGLIYSGIYNSTSGLNDLNQFIQAEKITKDLNPIHGSIQKLHARNTDLVTLCEDKIFKILANKDAVYNADGNPQLTANENVLGQTIPFSGQFGMSQNPESFAAEAYRAYFTDKSRGVVLRLSQDGLTPISDAGMSDYFGDNLKLYNKLIGSFDASKGEYNLTLKDSVAIGTILNPAPITSARYTPTPTTPTTTPIEDVTLSFAENVKGWVSFKSFIQEGGLSLNNSYYTFSEGDIYEHHINENRGNFYDVFTEPSVTVLFNEEPSSVKSFTTLNYEGTQAKITPDIEFGPEYYDNEEMFGWYVDRLTTNLQTTGNLEFKDKEDKWFSRITGETTEWLDDGNAGNIDTREFSYQGIDEASAIIVNPGVESWKCVETTFPFSTSNNVSNDTCGSLSNVYNGTTIDSIPTFLIYVAFQPSNQSSHFQTLGVKIPFTGMAGSGYDTQNNPNEYCFVNDIDDTNGHWVKPGTMYRHTLMPDGSGSVIGIPGGTSAEACIQWFMDNTSGSFYQGMSYNEFANTIAGQGLTYQGNIIQNISLGMSPCQCTYSSVTTNCDAYTDWVVGGQTTGQNQSNWVYFNNGNLPSSTEGTIVTDPSSVFGATGHIFFKGDIIQMPSGRVWYNDNKDNNPTQDPEGGSSGHGWIELFCTECECVSVPYSFDDPGTYSSKTACENNTTDCCGSGTGVVSGCTDSLAVNYDPLATIDDGSCTYTPSPIYGCTDPLATNYDPNANLDDGSCIYPPPQPVPGCTDRNAGNYDPNATIDDGSCTYVSSSCPQFTSSNWGVTTGDDTGDCGNPNNDGWANIGIIIPNFQSGDTWTYEVVDAVTGVVVSPYVNPAIPVQNGGSWMGNGIFTPGCYTGKIYHTLASGTVCTYTFQFCINCN